MGIHYRKEIKKVYYGEKKVLMMYAGDKRVWFDPPAQKDCLTLQFIEDSSAEGAVNTITGATDVFVSINDGEWQQLSSEGITFESLAGTKLYLWKRTSTSAEEGTFSLSDAQQFSASGNIASLLNFSETLPERAFWGLFTEMAIKTAPELPAVELADSCYSNMFSGCTSLTEAPELPAVELADGCYSNMFSGCTSLTIAPELPATVMKSYCYYRMFYGCTSLTAAPELPAVELADSCYSNMFRGCTSLTAAPELPAAELADECYFDMFSDCTSLTIAPELPAVELADHCYNGMFYGCTSLTIAPELPATVMKSYCYYRMFRDCTSLTAAPELPAVELADSCYQTMFYDCISLTSIKTKHTQWSVAYSTGSWVYGVAPSGTFYKPSALPEEYGFSRIPEGWIVVNIDAEQEGDGV